VYSLDGKDVSNLSASDRARVRNREIGFVFQAFNLIGDLTVYENVELPLTYRGMSASERKERVHAALERVGMSHRTKHYPSQLSGGQQQRVAVARAIVGKPLILLADEPTGNLDSKNGEAVMDLLKELHADGATICMVTHDPRYARHAERSIHLFDGQVVRDEDSSKSRARAGGERLRDAPTTSRMCRGAAAAAEGRRASRSRTAHRLRGVLQAVESSDFDAVLMDLNYTRDTTSGREGSTC
jgi:putative ABC transport system ATP-binding protein